MSKFNKTLVKPKTLTTNLAGGEAYKQSDELELVSILLTSFVTDQFYRSADDTLAKLKTLLDKVDPKFAAKAAIFARDNFGMRSITHALAAELTKRSAGQDWSKNFYDKVVVRPDDMTEILSYYINKNSSDKKIKFPNALKKGFSSAFDKFDNYQISKYISSGKDVKLVDVVNLVHPTPSERNSDSLKNLISGTLRNTDTWESKLSQAGQEATDDESLKDLKGKVWSDMLSSHKIGIMAILRNLRNIIEQSPESVELACSSLRNVKLIQKSRLFPFRFKTAYDEIVKLPSSKIVRDVLVALSDAIDISALNVPKFDGETLVVIDTSSSMRGKPSDIGSLFAAMLAKINNCDVMTFDSKANYVNYNPSDSILTIKNSFVFNGGSTNFKDIFLKANKVYKRFIILSDMQGLSGKSSPIHELSFYKKTFNCDPFIYSWDLNGYGSLQFPEKNIFALAGFSDKVFQIMEYLEKDKNALISAIKEIVL